MMNDELNNGGEMIDELKENDLIPDSSFINHHSSLILFPIHHSSIIIHH
jgi:hypothetical protein